MNQSNWTIGECVVVKQGVVSVKYKQRTYALPLCDLKAQQADASTRQLVDDYAVWFANR